MECVEPGKVAIATSVVPSAKPRLTGRNLARVLIAGAMLAILGETLRVTLGSNFHVLVEGECYRCSQPSPRYIEQMARDYKVRTVVNLRGRCEEHDWFNAEGKACQDAGVSLENLTYSAGRLPSRTEVRRLLEIFDKSERPLLLHCRQGADRTGLAAAAFLLSQTTTPYSEARSKMSLRYGHWQLGGAGVLQRFFHLYEAWLKDEKLDHAAPVFRRWLNEHYGSDFEFRVTDFAPMQDDVQAGKPSAFRVTLRNEGTGTFQFSTLSRAGVHLVYQCFDYKTGTNLAAGKAGFLDRAVGPGEEIALTMTLTPLPPGRHRLRVDLMEEGHAFFSQLGIEPWEQELIVRE